MRHSEPIEPEAAVQFQQEGVSGKTPCRERVLPTQGLQAYRHTLRQIGPKLSRLDLSRSHHRLVDFMSLDPRSLSDLGLAARMGFLLES
jgi:hypothetical protein